MEFLKQINPLNTICFSGHRPSRLPGRGEYGNAEAEKIMAVLRKQIENAIMREKDTFVNGYMAGWDILAAEQVITLKKTYPHIRLVTIAPYSARYFNREKCWTPEWIERAKMVCCQQEIGIEIAERYRAGVYYERNRKLVDCSSELICYWDGGKGGTEYTATYAKNKGLDIYNLFRNEG